MFSASARLITGMVAALACGCADVGMAPYARPDVPAKPSWSGRGTAPVSAAATITADWWKQFRDPYLDALVRHAIAGNVDVKILAARIQVAGAQVGEARAGALPSLDLGAGASFEKSTGQKFTRQFNLGTQVNWDVDVWGKVEKGTQAQAAEYHASEADWRAGYLKLVSDVSTTYFQILQFDEQIDRQRHALDKSRQILTIYEAMFQNGLLPNTRVLQQRAEINRLTNELLELQRLRDLAGNALATLMGIPAGEFKVPAAHLQERVQCPMACHPNCSNAGPTLSRPNTGCWRRTTWSDRPSLPNCHRSA
jgi:outer membrane protein TolC